jgi:hypothetical protein
MTAASLGPATFRQDPNSPRVGTKDPKTHICPEPEQVMIGIDTDRGPWAKALVTASYRVYALNPVDESGIF